MGQGVDPAVRSDLDVVMDAIEIFPDDMRILGHLHQPQAPRRIADAAIDSEQIAVREQMDLVERDEGIGPRLLHHGTRIPDLAEGQAPFMGDPPFHVDQIGRRVMAGAVERVSTISLPRVIGRDTARRSA
jgi:hypothetical protein